MHFDYGTQLSPAPIKLSIGTLKKPKLLEISELGFDKFNMFEAFLKMTPELFYTKIKGDEGKTYWESLSEQKQEDISLYSLILADESLQETYLSISTEIVISEDYVYLACANEMSTQTDATYTAEGDRISWFTSDASRCKTRGIIIPADSTYYADASDPTTNTAYDVKAGDVWKKSNGQGYIYVDQDYLDKYNITPDIVASIGGGWITASYWWLRSPNVGTTTYFWSVDNYGGLSYHNASSAYSVCPCFSI